MVEAAREVVMVAVATAGVAKVLARVAATRVAVAREMETSERRGWQRKPGAMAAMAAARRGEGGQKVQTEDRRARTGTGVEVKNAQGEEGRFEHSDPRNDNQINAI